MYRSDGDSKNPMYRTLTRSNASIYGVFITSEGAYSNSRGFQFNVNNLKKGSMYRLRIFVGVWDQQGTLTVEMDGNVGFMDSTVLSFCFPSVMMICFTYYLVYKYV